MSGTSVWHAVCMAAPVRLTMTKQIEFWGPNMSRRPAVPGGVALQHERELRILVQ